MDERTQRVAELLHEAAEVHHVVYRITDGADDDWASFYAHWLTRHSELGEVLGAAMTPQLWGALHDQRAYDLDAHRAALAALPESWERERPGGPAPPASRAAHALEAKKRRKAERAARRRNRRR